MEKNIFKDKIGWDKPTIVINNKFIHELSLNKVNETLEKYPNIDLKKYTTVINKDKKLRPIFGEVDEFKIDKTTGRPGTTKEFKTGKQLYNVQIESIPESQKNALRKKLINN